MSRCRCLPCGVWIVVAAALLAACGTVCQAADDAEPEDNPYAAAPNLTRGELGEFIQQMRGKPASIRKRPGFTQAILDAADRILAGGETDETGTDALLVKFLMLHELADGGDKAADERLTALATARAADERKPVAGAAHFYLLERKALDADALDAADLPPLVADLKKYCESEPLGKQHLRLASATVRIINRLPDPQAAAEAYREFGGLFAKSDDPELARYGKKIQTGPKRVGKPAVKPAEPPAADPQ